MVFLVRRLAVGISETFKIMMFLIGHWTFLSKTRDMSENVAFIAWLLNVSFFQIGMLRYVIQQCIHHVNVKEIRKPTILLSGVLGMYGSSVYALNFSKPSYFVEPPRLPCKDVDTSWWGAYCSRIDELSSRWRPSVALSREGMYPQWKYECAIRCSAGGGAGYGRKRWPLLCMFPRTLFWKSSRRCISVFQNHCYLVFIWWWFFRRVLDQVWSLHAQISWRCFFWAVHGRCGWRIVFRIIKIEGEKVDEDPLCLIKVNILPVDVVSESPSGLKAGVPSARVLPQRTMLYLPFGFRCFFRLVGPSQYAVF